VTLLRAAYRNDPALAEHLVSMLFKGGEQANAAADVLADLQKDAAPAIPALRRMLSDRDFGICRRALTVVTGLGPVAIDAEHELAAMMFDPAWEVREAIAPALLAVTADNPVLHQQVEEVCGPLLVLRDNHAVVARKIEACNQLRKLGPRALPAALELRTLVVEDGPARVDAAYALLAIGNGVARVLAEETPPPGILRRLFPPQPLFSSRTPLDELNRTLTDQVASRRLAACAELKNRGPSARDALSYLRARLGDPNADVRSAAGEAIVAIDPTANPTLVRAAASMGPVPTSQTPATLRLLRKLQTDGADIDDALPAVAELLLCRVPAIHDAAREIVSRMPAPSARAIASLRVFYSNAWSEPHFEIDNETRVTILRVLVRADAADPQTRTFVEAALKDPGLGDLAAGGLADLGTSAAGLAPLCLELSDQPPPVRGRAIRVLCGITPDRPDAAVIRVLTLALDDPDATQRRQAAAALARTDAPANERIGRLVKLLNSDNDADVKTAAQALADLGSAAAPANPDIVREVRARIEHTAPGSADPAGAACAACLAKLSPGSKEANELLLLAVQRKDWAVREQLAPALAGRPTPPTLLAALIDLSKSPDSIIRVNARCALREIGEP
jgi:HEAT repeat protein